MADRTVKVTLVAQASGYISGMSQAAAATRTTGSEIDKLAQKRQAYNVLGTAAIAFGLAAAAGVGLAIAKYAEFDQAMSNANAILQESADNQKLLRDAALEAGGATVFTARESANAIEELGKAGIGTSQILSGALRGSLDLAASGQLAVARAAEITGITLKQFNLDGTEAGRVADVLSAGANAAVGSVEDLAQGLKFVGPIASGMKVSLEDTVATLTLFSDQGVIGEQAGTSLRGMLLSLTSPSKLARDEMERLGITLYDSTGRFLGLENAAGELHRVLGNVDQQTRDTSLGILFTNQQVTTASLLVDAGAEKWREYRDAVDDSGIAQRIAAQRMDNLAGDVEKLGGAFDTALIQTGSGANEVMRSMVQTLTFLVDAAGELDPAILSLALGLTAVAGAAALGIGGFLKLLPLLSDGRNALEAFGLTSQAASGLMKGLGIAIGVAGVAATVAIAVFGAWAQAQADAKSRTDAYRDSLNRTTGAITGYTRELVSARLEEQGALRTVDELGVSREELIDATLRGSDALKELEDRIIAEHLAASGAVEGTDEYRFALNDIYAALHEVFGAAGGEASAIEESKSAHDRMAPSVKSSADELTRLADEASGAEGDIESLREEIEEFARKNLDARAAQRDLEAAIDDASAAIEENRKTLRRGTDDGRENEKALDAIADAAFNAADAIRENGGSQDEANAAIQRGREELIKLLAQFDVTGAKAESYADKLGLIPSEMNTTLKLSTADARAKIDVFIGRLREAQRLANLGGYRIPSPSGYNPAASANGNMFSYADGGFGAGIYAGALGPLYKFAEPETGWEAFISGKQSQRSRNVSVWREAGDRLGAWRDAPTSLRIDPDMSRVGAAMAEFERRLQQGVKVPLIPVMRSGRRVL